MKKQELDVNLINSNISDDENYFISDILKSVNLFGQLQPIIVKKDKRKTYTLIDGSKRLISLKMCGYYSKNDYSKFHGTEGTKK